MKERQAGYRIPVLWWGLCFLLILAFQNPTPGNRATLIPVTHHTLLTEDQDWHIPFSQIDALTPLGSINWIAIAVLGGLSMALLAQRLERVQGFWFSLLVICALSVGIRDVHLFVAGMLGILIWILNHSSHSRVLPRIAVAVILGFSVMMSLEFGFLWFYSAALMIPAIRDQPDRRDSRKYLYQVLALYGLLVVASCLHAGFLATLLRPINWWRVEYYPGILDSLRPSLSWQDWQWNHLPHVLVLGMGSILTLTSSDKRVTTQACVLAVAFLGMLCSYYLWLSTAAVAISLAFDQHKLQAEHSSRNNLQLLTIIGICAFSFFQLARPGMFLRDYLTLGTIPSHRVDPAQWRSSGPVILLNLDHSSEWQNPLIAKKSPLVLDDRWEIYGNRYRKYSMLVSDFKEMRSLVYFSSNLELGGFLHQTKQWQPALLVVDSDETDALRNLSLSPDWKMMSVDSAVTIFGNADQSANQRQIQTAGQTFLNLEWPHSSSSEATLQSIAASTSDELLRVSRVFSAIRLPYASLRLLPEMSSLESQKTQTWSYLELAHRIFRNTGTHSLIDEPRANTLIRELGQQQQWNSIEAGRLTRSLRGLGRTDFQKEMLALEPVSHTHLELEKLSTDELERELRSLICRGEIETAFSLIELLPERIHPFFITILQSQSLALAERAKTLYSASQSSELPKRLRAELLFYVGCLAIELGDTNVAIGSLSESSRIDQDSAFSTIRLTYLQQLSRP